MSYIPKITLNNGGEDGTAAYTATLNRTGTLTNSYSPFKNLLDSEHDNVGDFTTPLLNFDLEHPVDIIPQDSYDGSVNLILNDGKNQPRLIGSRFSVIDEGQFKITDHTGFKDTNIYDEDTFDVDTSLKVIALHIPQIEYKGLTQFGGSLPCGAYTFYFKLADADGNESEVVAESGMVQVFIGGLIEGKPTPESIRMGLEDENSGKSVSFKLTNIDSGFDYVHVLYARSSSGNEQAAVDTYHRVIYDFPTFNGEADITITGKETILDISANELYVDYADIEAVKTQTVVNNVLFFGNTIKKERDWDALRIASWKIVTTCDAEPNVGSISYNYKCFSDGRVPEEQYSGCYYNTFNTYYRVGYWPDEIYQFGIVYIFNDNSLSPVFNLLGADLSLVDKLLYLDMFSAQRAVEVGQNKIVGYQEWEAEPEDYYFNKELRLNSRGVIKLPNLNPYAAAAEGRMRPRPIYLEFDLSNIGMSAATINDSGINFTGLSTKEFFEKHDIKGYFFVRKTRIPTILALGLTIGLTDKDHGAIPTLRRLGNFSAQSFLSPSRFLELNGSYVTIKADNVDVNAALVPDAEMSEATFNLLFVSNKFTLSRASVYSFADIYDKDGFTTAVVKTIVPSRGLAAKRKLTVVLDGVKTLTDGEVYFSTQSGNPSEAVKTSDVQNVWNKTAPQDLTKSNTLIRGNWGPFVGIGNKESDLDVSLNYGCIYNIKSENYSNNDLNQVLDLEFLLRFNDVSGYKAICPRTEYLSDDNNKIRCYRGDCFLSLFTHRMFRNFIDPELPTNDKIINPKCWAENYAVRCTAVDQASADFNVKKENLGWYISKGSLTLFANEVASAFEVKEQDDAYKDLTWDATALSWMKDGKPVFTPPSINSADNYITGDESRINKINPKELESSNIGSVLKNLFKSDKWALRGIASINRADVNAVALGHWITFPICSSKNLALRDVDYSNATELAAFNRKRSFFPLSPKDAHNPLRDSNIINLAASISLPHKLYFAMPNVPFIKQEYFTRIINSLRDSAASITNEFKVMLENAYRDYTKVYGPITKLVAMGSNMLVVFHHGLGVLSISDSMSLAKDASQYLPVELNMVISLDYGSMWKDSVLSTESGNIYGVDTVAKVIWCVHANGPQFELLSSLKVEKFLIDCIDLSEYITKPYVGRVNVKTHYNAFKRDVLFTYYNDILYLFPSSNLSKTEDGYYSYDISGSNEIAEFGIDAQGYLLNSLGIRLLASDGVDLEPGTKIVGEYNSTTGKVEGYTDKIAKLSNPKVLKWATGKSWSLCWSENLKKFITFYDWIPLESENIDNIWFSIDREAANTLAERGVRGELKTLRYPSANNDELLFRDLKYGRYAMDKAFNTTIPITYLLLGKLLTYDIGELEFNPNKKGVTLIGFYLSGNREESLSYKVGYTVGNVTTWYEDLIVLPIGDSWRFIAMLIYPQLSKQSIQCTVQLMNPNEDVTSIGKYGAVTDMIVKTNYDEQIVSESVTKNEFVLWFTPGDTTIDKYYYIRDLEDNLKIWKHGLAGIYDNADYIKPTHWYGLQHEFNFEFIARKDVMHKVFTNLLLISNKAEPNKFEVEVVGEVYDWHNLKPVLKWIADLVEVPTEHAEYDKYLQKWYKYVLSQPYGELIKDSSFPRIFGMKNDEKFKKLPYMKVTDALIPSLDPQVIGRKKGEKNNPSIYLTPEQQERGMAHSDNTSTTALVYDRQLNEFRVHTELLGNNMWKYGRLRGNMQYLEDLWRVELRPVAFKYAYLIEGEEDIQFTKIQETRPRDKYIKIKVRYSGEDLAVILAVQTIFDYSYA